MLAEPEAFAPYGALIRTDAVPGRTLYPEALSWDDRPVVMSTTTVEPDTLPIHIDVLERHPHSSQTFLPARPVRWVVVVATDLDPNAVRAFDIPPDTAVSIGRGIWHHRLTALGAGASFWVLMARDHETDDEFSTLPVPVRVVEAERALP